MTIIEKNCKECGFFNDCPIDYKCPGVAMLHEIAKQEGAVFLVHQGTLIEIRKPMKENEEEDEEE